MGNPSSLVILDTHVWLWWLHDPEQLSAKAAKRIREAERRESLRVSAISVWEVAVKSQLGKLSLPMEINSWFEKAESYPGCVIEPLSPSDALASTQLPGDFHKDPADRILIAMARRYGVPLITSDRRIRSYPHVETIW
jgi:PIN domain nuclease of toxin-antitoxin system